MQMEHQQFYKMVAFEASTRVPLVIAGPGVAKGLEIRSLHSLVDLLPTFLALGGAALPAGHTVDGTSLPVWWDSTSRTQRIKERHLQLKYACTARQLPTMLPCSESR